MNGRRAIVGLCMLCALAFSAFAAQGAAAATKGTTAFTCVKGATPKDFVKEHCKAGDVGTNEYGHVPIAENLTTHLGITNAKTNAETNNTTPSTLKSTVAGSPIELVATGVSGTGGLENKKEASGEHYIHGHEIVLKYTGVTVKNLPKCEVFGTPGSVKETVETKKLTATTAGKGDAIEFKPEVAPTFAEFHITGVGCVLAEPPAVLKISVVGTIICKPEGATINCNHEEVTKAATLRINNPTLGPVAGLEGKVTVTGGKLPVTEPTNPISVTTVETA